MATRKVVAARGTPVAPPRGIGVGPRRGYASGGELRSVPVTPRAELPRKRETVKEEEPSLMDRAKKALGIGGKPTIEGGMQDAIKKREKRYEAIERGEQDPGQENVKLARGGKVKKAKKK